VKEKIRMERGVWPVQPGEGGGGRMHDRQAQRKAEEKANRGPEYVASQPQTRAASSPPAANPHMNSLNEESGKKRVMYFKEPIL